MKHKDDTQGWLYTIAVVVSVPTFLYLCMYALDGKGSTQTLRWVLAAYLVSTFIIGYRHFVDGSK